MVTRKTVEQVQPGALLMPWRGIMNVIVAGMIAGLLTMALFIILDKYVFSPTLCSDLNAGTGRCENKLLFASGVAMVLAGLAVLVYFVRQRVYRPLLVVIMSLVALWNIPTLIVTLALFPAVLITLVIFGLTYGLFAWIVQLRNFVLALVLAILAVIALRFFIVS